MAIITRTSHRVLAGAPSTLPRAPSPLRTRGHRTRGGEEKEIEVISAVKEVARAREPGRGHAPHWDDVLAGAVFQAQRKVDINSLVSFVKESGLRNKEGEAGYILSRLAETAFETGDLESLKPELKGWYDAQLANMESVLEKAKREIEKRIRKLKSRGDYTSADILRIKTAEYPKWSTQYIGASNKLQKVKAKGGPEAVATEQAKAFAGVRAKTAEVDLGDLTEKQIVSLKKASQEKAIDESVKLGLSAEQIMAIRATPKRDRKAFAEAYKNKVEGITIAPETVEEPVITIKATPEEIKIAKDAKTKAKARGISCYTQLYPFKVALRNGEVIIVEALSKSSAEQKAKDAGHKPAWVTRMMSWESIKPSKKETGAFNVTKKDGETVTMVPFEHHETGETLLIPRDVATELKDTQAYKDAKGTNEHRLGIAYTAAQKEFDGWLKELKDTQPDLYKLYEDEGYDVLAGALEKQAKEQRDILSKLDNYKKGDKYDITTAFLDGAVKPDELKGIFKGCDIEDTEKWLNTQEKFLKLTATEQGHTTMMARGKLGLYAEPYSKMTPDEKLQVLGYYKEHGVPTAGELQKKYARQYSLEPIVAFTPVAGTVYYWNKMSPTWKAISIATDVLCLGFIVSGAAAGARAARGYTAAARVKGAVKGAGETILAEITAPGELIAHPIQTTKGIGRQIQSAIETLLHPRKLPLGAAELTYTTTRLPIEDVGGAKKAMQLRDAAVKSAIQGKPAKATVGGTTLTLNPSELEKVGGAMAIHSTPDVRPFLNGAAVQGGAEGSGIFVSPNLHSRFAQATAFGDIPEGGIQGGLIIRDKKILNAIVPSGKTYLSTAEIEALLKPGTKLPPPSQVLFTRDIAGNKLTLLVIGDPFTSAQVAKLKFLGSLDTVNQIFKPTMKLTGAQKAAINVMDDIISLSKERAAMVANLEAARAAGRSTVQFAGRATTLKQLGQHIAEMDRRIASLVERVNAPRLTVRPDNIIWGQYADKGLLDRWRELTPDKPARTARGTKLPDIEAGATIRRASLPEQVRRIPPGVRRIPRGARRVPPEGRRVAAEGRRVPSYTPPYTRLYTPVYVPPYTPAYTPPYVPAKTPPTAPPPRPYVPPRMSRVPTAKAPPPIPKKPRMERVPIKLGREKIPMPGKSLVSWRQGMYYITVVEPYRTTGTKPDVIYSRHRPPWGKVVKGKHSPQRSLKSIGKVPTDIKLPMGRTTARVKQGRVLRFHGRRG